jgi:hypothetical protein
VLRYFIDDENEKTIGYVDDIVKGIKKYMIEKIEGENWGDGDMDSFGELIELAYCLRNYWKKDDLVVCENHCMGGYSIHYLIESEEKE